MIWTPRFRNLRDTRQTLQIDRLYRQSEDSHYTKNININFHVCQISGEVRPENRPYVTLHDINLFNRFYDRHNASKCRTTDLIQFKFNRQFVLIV